MDVDLLLGWFLIGLSVYCLSSQFMLIYSHWYEEGIYKISLYMIY